MELQEIEQAIEVFEAKIRAQGIVTNERDVQHLANLKELRDDLLNGID